MTESKHTPEIAITERMYAAYGTDTGILLGIPADLRGSVEAIVKIAIEETAAPETAAERDRLRGNNKRMLDILKRFGIWGRAQTPPEAVADILEDTFDILATLGNAEPESGEKEQDNEKP